MLSPVVAISLLMTMFFNAMHAMEIERFDEKKNFDELKHVNWITDKDKLDTYLGYTKHGLWKPLHQNIEILSDVKSDKRQRQRAFDAMISFWSAGFVPAKIIVANDLKVFDAYKNTSTKALRLLSAKDPRAAMLLFYNLSHNETPSEEFLQLVRERNKKRYVYLPHVQLVQKWYLKKEQMANATSLQKIIAEKSNDSRAWFDLAACYEKMNNSKDQLSCLRKAVTWDPHSKTIKERYLCALAKEHTSQQSQVDECIRVLDLETAQSPHIVAGLYDACLHHDKMDFLQSVLQRLAEQSKEQEALIFLRYALERREQGDASTCDALMKIVRNNAVLTQWYAPFCADKEGFALVAEQPINQEVVAPVKKKNKKNKNKKNPTEKKSDEKEEIIDVYTSAEQDPFDALSAALEQNNEEAILAHCTTVNKTLLECSLTDDFFNKAKKWAQNVTYEKLEKHIEKPLCAITLASVRYLQSLNESLSAQEVLSLVSQAKDLYVQIRNHAHYDQFDFDKDCFEKNMHHVYKALGILYLRQQDSANAQRALDQAGQILLKESLLEHMADYALSLVGPMKELAIKFFHEGAKKGDKECTFYYLYIFNPQELEACLDDAGKSRLNAQEYETFTAYLKNTFIQEALTLFQQKKWVDTLKYDEWKKTRGDNKKTDKQQAADAYIQGIEAFFQDRNDDAWVFFSKAENQGIIYAKKYLAIISELRGQYSDQTRVNFNDKFVKYAQYCLMRAKKDAAFAADLAIFDTMFRLRLNHLMNAGDIAATICLLQDSIGFLNKGKADDWTNKLHDQLMALNNNFEKQKILNFSSEQKKDLKKIFNTLVDPHLKNTKTILLLANIFEKLALKNQLYETEAELHAFYERHIFARLQKEKKLLNEANESYADFKSLAGIFQRIEADASANRQEKKRHQEQAVKYYEEALQKNPHHSGAIIRYAHFYLGGQHPNFIKNPRGAFDKGMNLLLNNATNPRIAAELAKMYEKGANFPFGRIAPNPKKAAHYKQIAEKGSSQVLTAAANNQPLTQSPDQAKTSDDEQETDDDTEKKE